MPLSGTDQRRASAHNRGIAFVMLLGAFCVAGASLPVVLRAAEENGPTEEAGENEATESLPSVKQEEEAKEDTPPVQEKDEVQEAPAPLPAVKEPEKTPVEESEQPPVKESNPFPKFEEIQQTVTKELGALANYKSGDLLTDRSVTPIFKKLESLGWVVAERKEIEKLLLPEGDWIARQFRTANGRKFMREVARNPSGFDRIDRLRRMPRGEQQLADLIRQPEGYKMIEYMVTTPGGKNLGKSLSKGVNGGKFNEPTGRLYTEKQLLDRLKQSHDAELQRRGQTS